MEVQPIPEGGAPARIADPARDAWRPQPAGAGGAHAAETSALNALSHLSRLVTRGADVATVLDAVCEAIAHVVGFSTAVVNLCRPGKDELVVSTVHGDAAVARALLGATTHWAEWRPLLDERFRRGEAYFVPHGAVDWLKGPSASFVPAGAAPTATDAWHPEDALFVVLEDPDGEVLGVVSVDEPASGRRPTEADVDLLCAVAAHAGLAIAKAQQDAALRASEALKSAMFTSALDAIVSFDARGRVLDFNAAAEAMFGLARAEALGADVVTLLRPAVADPRAGLARYVEGEPLADGRIELVLVHRDGHEMTVELALARARADDEEVFTAFLRDVSDRVAATRALVAERDRAQGYLDVAETMIVVLDRDGRVVLANRKTCEVVGYSEAELVGADWFETCSPPELVDEDRAAFDRLIAGTDLPAWADAESVTRDGRRRSLVWHDTLLRDETGAVTGMLSSGHDVTEHRAAQDRIAFLAFHDELTRLPNRAHARRHLDAALEAARAEGRSVALLYLDLDGFKLVNDGLGHTAGDELLRQVAARLEGAVEPPSILARVGGDEFVVIVPAITGDARETAERASQGLLGALEAELRVARVDVTIGASVGISIFPDSAADAEALFKQADVAMFSAKQAGRGRHRVYEATQSDPRRNLSLMGDLRHALDRDEFELHYQPIVAVADGRVTGVEALIRWRRGDGTLVPPGDFVPIAEQTGLIDGIGQWVVEEACRQAAEWHAAGHGLNVAFNLSPNQLENREIERVVERALRDHGVDPSTITAELTETALGRHERSQLAVLEALDGMGVRLAIDDFGAGYSSLSRLRALRCDALKIDRSFLADVAVDPDAAEIVGAIVQLARGLGMSTVGEGVEGPEQLAFLRRVGCVSAQGFHLARPMPAAGIVALLGEPRAIAA